MKIAFFSTQPYDKTFFAPGAAAHGHTIDFLEPRLSPKTAPLAAGHEAVCAFVNDDLGAATLEILARGGTRLIALRSAGYNHVDLSAAKRLGMTVVRVPAYSPHAVAEHTIALLLGLVRKTHRAHARVREGNFSLDGLLGFDLHGKMVGVIGTGRIGAIVVRILSGFGCRILAFDPFPNADIRVDYLPLDEIWPAADILTLHCPLTPESRHLVSDAAIARMKPGVVLLNTSRGALLDTRAVIRGLKSGRIGGLGLDVYEEEGPLFFEDRSSEVIQDDVFMRLLTFPNVLVTGHQAFFTSEALHAISETTLSNLDDCAAGRPCPNVVKE